jgi:hypothetical protein
MTCRSISKHNFRKKQGLHNTPVSFENINLPSYISGYIDGEGSFCVSISKSARHKFGWEVRPSFSVSQNVDRSEVLEYIKHYFKCGSIRSNVSDNTLKYEVRSIKDLMNTIIPHFEKYKILSGKSRDFDKFKKVCELVVSKKHLEKEGFNEIISIISTMNPSGTRKYSPQEIRYSQCR